MVDYVGDTRGNVCLPGVMMLGYIAAHSETLALAVIVSKVEWSQIGLGILRIVPCNYYCPKSSCNYCKRCMSLLITVSQITCQLRYTTHLNSELHNIMSVFVVILQRVQSFV